jgi:transcriptional regulator NrdR family protein
MDTLEFKRNDCPNCQSRRTVVLDTVRATPTATVRHHECRDCGKRFKTCETIVDSTIKKVDTF